MGGAVGRVLVVDDEPQVRNALARTVRGLGYVPVVAASAEEAVALSQDDRFEVVVSDIGMPGMDGLSMLQRLSPFQPDARFVIVTGYPSVEPQSLPLGHRCKVIRKPWAQDRLEAAIRGDNEGTPSTLPPPMQRAEEPTKVLLVEDDAGDALLFETALRLAHPGQFNVLHATTFADAQRLISEERPDVVALDLDLGEMSGLQTVARVQAEAPNLGMVVLSGKEDPGLALRSVQVGAQDYLVKGKVGGATIGKALRYAEERKRVEMRLAELAFHDQLTGLANRTLFRQRIAQATARARRSGAAFGVLLLDLDRFKNVNDALGHDAGDIYLQQVAARLRSATRETDTVARFGGDEFAILAEPVAEPADVERLAQRVLAKLRRPLNVSGVTLEPTASIGAAIYPGSGDDSDSLLSAADAAMYVVKAEGRNGCHVHGIELTQQIARRVDLEDRLRQAVDKCEFELHYQPQVSVDGDFRGAEALLRWLGPEGHHMSACEFVPVLEECGLIVPLGPWILDKACAQLASWRATGVQVNRIAVNISAKQFARPNLPHLIREAVSTHNLGPADLEIELTETAFLNDSDAVASVLRELNEDGFSLALDDFGTGYSSLAHLQAFPINTLKIDRTFVRGVAQDAYRRNLVGGIIHLAQLLGLEVIAEGVEDEQQMRVLCDQGCTILQGHHLGVPVCGEDFGASMQVARRTVPPAPFVSRRPAKQHPLASVPESL